MKIRVIHIAHLVIHNSLMLFWFYVSLDKLWELNEFHYALLKQPIPSFLANILYWSLPSFELLTAAAFIVSDISSLKITVKGNKLKISPTLPYLFSGGLLFIFSMYILFGLLGFYSKIPCGCASVFKKLTWGQHLLINASLFALSLLGYFLSINQKITVHKKSIKRFSRRVNIQDTLQIIYTFVILSFHRLFPRKYALFPAGPVLENTPFCHGLVKPRFPDRETCLKKKEKHGRDFCLASRE